MRARSLAGVLVFLPVTMFVGERDEAWLGAVRETAARLEQVGGVVSLTVVPGEGHVIRGLDHRRSDALARVLEAARLR